ncbi:MAG: UvrD-helicase domain-containing protein [Rhizomicrobium sp.]|jgi:DNA helicase-2/ATP-dependent DNA helicase PcrA
MKLTTAQEDIMATKGHILVRGGPGSGKTTVAILKAASIAEHDLKADQRVLFLSFARATVSRVIEAIEHEQLIPLHLRRRIVVETYHSFFWRILKTHGYLIGLPRKLSLLTPPAEAVALSTLRAGYPADNKLSNARKAEKAGKENEERIRLSKAEGRLCFDLFARYAGDIVHGSGRIRRLLATMYPVVILDEFQDTNADQWRVVQALGQYTTLLALADPEQRIYDWIGADPERLNHFRDALHPAEFDLSTDNHRSAGTEITVFGNDILKGKFKETYKGITCQLYEPNQAQARTALMTTTYKVRKRLVTGGKADWSLAILVPTKRMTRLVSDTFREPLGGLTPIPHTAAIDTEPAILGAEIIAHLMQPFGGNAHFDTLIELLCSYFQGKGGSEPTKSDLAQAERIRAACEDYAARAAAGKAQRKSSVRVAIRATYEAAKALQLSGDPDKDWRDVRRVLVDGECQRLKEVAEEVRNVRLLDRGTQLREALSQDWRDHGTYANALEITRQAFVQEHFSTGHKPEVGVVVMNMHKSKGKQFDEVIIFEGWPRRANRKIVANPDRIVWSNLPHNANEQARQNLRVSVTRGKQGTTILTPSGDPCILLLDRR